MVPTTETNAVVNPARARDRIVPSRYVDECTWERQETRRGVPWSPLHTTVENLRDGHEPNTVDTLVLVENPIAEREIRHQELVGEHA